MHGKPFILTPFFMRVCLCVISWDSGAMRKIRKQTLKMETKSIISISLMNQLNFVSILTSQLNVIVLLLMCRILAVL